MKKLIPFLLLCLFALQSCRDKETVYIETPVVSQPEENDAQSPTDSGDVNDLSEGNNPALSQSTYSISCDSKSCDDSIGYVEYLGKLCQSVQIDERKVLLAKDCLGEGLMETSCSDLHYYSSNKSSSCEKIEESKNGYYELTLKNWITVNSKIIGKIDRDNKVVSQHSFSLSTNEITQNEGSCNLEYNSLNHLDANSQNSQYFYSTDCKEDFIFFNHELVGIKVGKDDYGFRYYNLSCFVQNCEKLVTTKDEKIISSFLNNTKLGKKLYPLTKKDNPRSTTVQTRYKLKLSNNEIIVKNDLKCFNLIEKMAYEQTYRHIPYHIDEKGLIDFKLKQAKKKHETYLINFYLENTNYINLTLISMLKRGVSSSVLSDLNYRYKFVDVYDIRDVMKYYEVYTISEKIDDYAVFFNDFLNNDLLEYKKSIVPNCSAL